MLNNFVLVGRLVSEPETIEFESKKGGKITLATPRSFKNANGEYDTDFIEITMWGSVAESTIEYCNKGDLVGVKGRIQSVMIEDKNVIEMVAERITFLSQAKGKEEN